MSWIERTFNKNKISKIKRAIIPKGIWIKCENCRKILYKPELERNLNVCINCNHHFSIPARKRLISFLDEESITELGEKLKPRDFLNFCDLKKYRDRIIAAQKKTHEKDALIVMKGGLKGIPIVAAAFEFSFMGGSMASVVGEKFVYAVNQALKDNCPLVCFSASGGARMQEALISLMQMAKTSAALAKMKEKKLLYISILTNPTMGGVSASLAILGDINIAEPNALIGFAGPRIIEQTVREKLPKEFQKSEFLMKRGMIDIILKRTEIRSKLADIISIITHRSIKNT